MPSTQARIAELFMRFQLSGWSKGTIAEQRSRQEKTARFARLPADIHCLPVDIHGIPAEWIANVHVEAGVILYLHGGAYALGSINVHREMVARLAEAAGIKALVINYRLAPEHPFPAALEDTIAAYDWLLAQGYDPPRIAIAGDSAGGGLAIAALVALRDAGEALPAAAVCISPWIDLTLSGASTHQNVSSDPILDPQSLAKYAGYYAGDLELTSPLISPLYANLEGLPPLLIQVGTHEILLDDATRLAENARQAGVDVTLETWDGMFHLFQIIPFVPETQRSIVHIAGFVTNKLKLSGENQRVASNSRF
jgi:epsilon-lactone hydrolase